VQYAFIEDKNPKTPGRGNRQTTIKREMLSAALSFQIGTDRITLKKVMIK
jgi:hypothetical protein